MPPVSTGQAAMPHDPQDERLSAYLDGQLAPAEREEIEALLRQRPELLTALDQMRQLGEGIRQLPRHGLGSQFAERVLAKVELAKAPVTPRRRGWLLIAVGATATVAALALAMVFVRPRPENVSQPPVLSPAEEAVAAMLAQAQDGQAVVVRLRLTKDALRGKALDQALAAHGIAAAPASAINPAAQESAQTYKSLAQNDPQAESAADVLFIEAEQAKLLKALAQVAQSPTGAAEIMSGGVIESKAAGIDRLTKAEGETGTVVEDVKIDGRNYAQHLSPRGFPLLKSPKAATPATTNPASQGNRPTRVLVIVEVIP